MSLFLCFRRPRSRAVYRGYPYVIVTPTRLMDTPSFAAAKRAAKKLLKNGESEVWITRGKIQHIDKELAIWQQNLSSPPEEIHRKARFFLTNGCLTQEGRVY